MITKVFTKYDAIPVCIDVRVPIPNTEHLIDCYVIEPYHLWEIERGIYGVVFVRYARGIGEIMIANA